MANATTTCRIDGQKPRGGTTYGTSAIYMGYGNGTTHYENVLSFVTSPFAGKCISITFNINCANTSLSANSSRTYRWALLTSDANAMGASTSTNFYYNTAKEVTDPNQIAQGTVLFGELNKYSNKQLTITTDALKGNTQYYLVLWPSTTSPTSFITLSAIANHGDVVIEYEASYSVKTAHYLMNANGSVSQWSSNEQTVDAGSVFTPALISPPTTNRSDGAIMFAYGENGKVESGTVVGFVVDGDTTAEIYYPLASGTVTVNIDGTARLCEVNYKS